MTAPAGPVIVSGKTNDNSAGPPFGPLMLNCPLLTGSVRSTTVGTPGRTVPKVTPRTPVMVSGLPCECSRPPISVASVSSSTRFIKSVSLRQRRQRNLASPWRRAGESILPPPGRRAISSTQLPRLVDHRHGDRTSIDTSSLVRRGLHLRAHPHKQITRAAERRGRARRRREGNAPRLRREQGVDARVADDRHRVRAGRQRGRQGERERHRGARLAGHVKATAIRKIARGDRLVHAREDVPEVQLLGANHVDRRLHACRRRDAGIVRLGLERRARQNQGGDSQGQLADGAHLVLLLMVSSCWTAGRAIRSSILRWHWQSKGYANRRFPRHCQNSRQECGKNGSQDRTYG